MTPLPAGLASVYIATVLLAINGLLSKTIHLDAVSITALRCAIACAALLAFARWEGSPWGFVSWRRKLLVIGLGVLMGLHWSLFFHAIQVSTVAIGILAHFSSPLITVTLEPLLDRRWPAWEDAIAAACVMLGLGIMVPQWSLDNQALWGIVFGLGSALTMASRNVFQRRWLQGESSAQGMVVQTGVAALLCLPALDVAGASALPASQWGYILLLGLVSTALAHTLLVVGLKHLPAKTVGLISCFQPPIAIVLSALLLREMPAGRTLVGGSLILACALYEAIKVQRRRG